MEKYTLTVTNEKGETVGVTKVEAPKGDIHMHVGLHEDAYKKNASSTSSSKNCLCGFPCAEGIVKKDGPNKGKSFYTCSRKENKCDMFQWK